MFTKKLLLIVITLAILSFFIFDVGHYLTLDQIKIQQAALINASHESPLVVASLYLGIYIAVTALSLPGAAIMTLLGGAVFGLFWGTILTSFASTIGATLAFLASRFLLRDWVQNRFGRYLSGVNKGIERDGVFYLFTLRLIPQVPFFVINLVMGLTRIRTRTFYWVSQLGMLAGTIVYVNAGQQLSQINSLKDILSVELILSFTLLGAFPLVAKFVIDRIKRNRVYKDYPRPTKFDRNLVVIGAGAAGLVTSYIAATVKAKVTLIEKHKMGGDCLNTGCVPSKALIKSAKVAQTLRDAAAYGLQSTEPNVDFAQVMARVQNVIRKIEPHDSTERYGSLGVECMQGEAKIISPYEVEVNGRTLTTRNIVIATGARPFVPPIKGLDQIEYLTSDNVWQLGSLPKRLIVLGGGPIGSELTQAFARLGSEVTQIEMAPRILAREDEEVSEFITQQFTHEGIHVLTDHKAIAVDVSGNDSELICMHKDREVRIPFDKILVAVGRAANTSGLGLENIQLPTNSNGTVEVDEYLRTKFTNILACGDVAGPYQFTHTAAHQAWYAAVNGLFGKFKKFKVDYSVIPWATFIDPEVARVGLNEQEARQQSIRYEATRYDLNDLDRAIADGSDVGWIKVLTSPGSDRILGVTIVGVHAGDLIAEYVLAMKHGLGLNKMLGTIHIYPTLAEANKFVAGEWKKARKPATLLSWLERYFQWQRG